MSISVLPVQAMGKFLGTKMKWYLKKIQYIYDLIYLLTLKEIKVRYKSSVLGYLWSIAMPLCYAFVFYISFKVVMKIKMENYSLFLICGLFPWQWFANSLGASSTVFLSNSSIIKKVNFPRSSVCIAMVLNDGVHFLLSIPVIILFLFLYHKNPSPIWLIGVPILFIVQFIFTLGLSLLISSINMFFRDLERLVMVFLTLLFYFTPIIYEETMIPERYRYLINLNPVAPLMVAWRHLFLNGDINYMYFLISFLYGLFFFSFGLWIFNILSPRFAEVL